MSDMSKISVQVTLTPDEGEDSDLDLVAEAFDEALRQLGCGYDNVIDKFFTMRFDETPTGAIAATISAAHKRD